MQVSDAYTYISDECVHGILIVNHCAKQLLKFRMKGNDLVKEGNSLSIWPFLLYAPVMYCYIIAPARYSIRSRSIHSLLRGIHSPLRGPNSRCASLFPVMSLFRSFPLSLHVPLCHCFHPFHYPALLLYTVPLYLVS